MHRGTFCSSESQRQQGLRSDRTATSLGISAHAAAAQHQGRRRGEGRGDVVGEEERGRAPPPTRSIRSDDSEINGMRVKGKVERLRLGEISGSRCEV